MSVGISMGGGKMSRTPGIPSGDLDLRGERPVRAQPCLVCFPGGVVILQTTWLVMFCTDTGQTSCVLFCFNILFIYLFEGERRSESTSPVRAETEQQSLESETCPVLGATRSQGPV